MYGYISAGMHPCLTRQQIGGVWFAVATVPQKGFLARYHRRRALRGLHRTGVTRCILPPEMTEEAAGFGLQPVAVCGLRRALLPQLLDMQGDLRRSTALLRAGYVSRAVYDAALVMARRVRYLALDTGGGTEMLARELRQRLGLCTGGMGQPAVTVSFGGAPSGKTICLGEDCRRYQQLEYSLTGEKLGAWPLSEQLLAALFEAGEIKKEEIHVKTIVTTLDTGTETYYNAT